MKQLYALLLLLMAIATMPGCGIGYNSLLFVTKSNVGLDFDAKPPTAELAISRVEGVIEPVFETGMTLPLMSSFRTDEQGLFAGSVGQTFTTGRAALIMATLYDSDTFEYDPLNGNWENDVEDIFESSLKLNYPPELPGDLKFATKHVRPVFFGTATSLGMRTTWSGITGALPDSFHVGYLRKEFALAPIAYNDKKLSVSVPSLISTLDVQWSKNEVRASQLEWLQYFATGKVATALALQEDVRKAMLVRLNPNQEMLVAEYDVSKLAKLIQDWLDETSDQDPNPRRTTIANFLTRENIGVSTTFWLRSSDKPGRTEQYQKFIDENEIE